MNYVIGHPTRYDDTAWHRIKCLRRFGFSQVKHGIVSVIVKRLFDIAFSLCILIALSPMLIGVALAIKLNDGGPIFFCQKRIGKRGHEFKMFKFRSMVPDAEQKKILLRLQNEMRGTPVFKMTNDPRITRIGHFIRKTSLDEFPQFINVLLGDMSVVGPRPGLEGEVRRYELLYNDRLAVKPGITCYWQISGRNEIPFDTWMGMDLKYVFNWTLWEDFKILARTIPAVLSKRGAK